MIDTEVLRKRTLEQAFKGKITRRSIDDENAGILYTHILSENKISNIENFEELYDIPDTWKWISLGNVGKWGAGATPSRKVKEYYGGNIPWLKTGDLNDGTINDIPEYITELALKETSVKINPIGSVLIAMYGATIGKLGILEIEATTNQACCACRTYDGIYNKYLFYYLMSQRDNLKYMGSGGAQSNISKEKIVGFSFPLAPYAEQIRVVDAIEVIFSELDQIDKLQKQYSSDLEALKSKIIDAGIQGKLTEQLPEDGSAEDLFVEIQAKKQQLIKEKRIKKEKSLENISEDEIPFEIPRNWKWVRIEEIAYLTSGKPYDEVEKGELYIKVSDMNLAENETEIVTSNHYVSAANSGKIPVGSLIFPKRGGAIATNKKRMVKQKDIFVDLNTMGMTMIIPEILDYVKVWFDSFSLDDLQTGTTIPQINNKDIYPLLMPLPPISEQRRIVDKLDNILRLM